MRLRRAFSLFHHNVNNIPTLNNYVRTHNKRDRVVNREIRSRRRPFNSTERDWTIGDYAQSGSYGSAHHHRTGITFAGVQNTN